MVDTHALEFLHPERKRKKERDAINKVIMKEI